MNLINIAFPGKLANNQLLLSQEPFLLCRRFLIPVNTNYIDGCLALKARLILFDIIQDKT